LFGCASANDTLCMHAVLSSVNFDNR